MTRIAAIDVGTNTAEILVADVSDGSIRPVYDDERFVRLGAGVDASGRVNEDALQRLKEALIVLRDAAEEHGAEAIIVGGTSASRDAANQKEIVAFVRRETGLDYEILSGDEEATWTFVAACAAVDALTGRCAVLDIGGGSTEIIIGQGDVRGPEAIAYRRSFNIGTVRLTERFFDAQPPDPAAVDRAEAFIDETLRSADVPLAAETPVIGNSGTAVALALINAGPEAAWDDLDADQRVLSAEAVRGWRERLLGATFDEVMALHPTVMQGRADIFPMGLVILDRILQQAGVGAFRVSPYQLRHGLLFRWMAERGTPQSPAE